MPKWLLENKVLDEFTEKLIKELRKQNFQYKIVTRFDNLKDLFLPEECVIFYGSLGMSQQVKRETPWIPGVYCDLPKYECVYYYPRLGKHLLNDNYVMMPFGDLKRKKDFLFELLSKDGKLFVRPSSGFKIFGGTIWSYEMWDYETVITKVDPERVVVIAPPQEIVREWRLVIVNNEVIGGSQYIENNEIVYGPCPNEIIQYGNEVLKSGYNPERAWTLDICQLKNQDLKVLEVNSFSSSGLYDSPMDIIVEKVSLAAQQDWDDIHVL